MPEYLFENPETGEVISVIQGIDEKHTYSEEGKEFSLDQQKVVLSSESGYDGFFMALLSKK